MESPTHVGNTRCHRTMRWRTSAHPHACGEYAACEAMYESYRGSSPRVWGIPGEDAAGVLTTRFIPTHVGNTGNNPRLCSLFAVHPHACGEYAARTAGRGERHRFIPTHVGNTISNTLVMARPSVHPHACGEYVHASVPALVGLRFIPTHVGNTLLSAASGGSAIGSSPRMWGIRHDCVTVKLHCRFIPTHVGNTPSPPPYLLPRSVHPHACGEYKETPSTMMSPFGSSPRMWGIHHAAAAAERATRFIPTHVGNTMFSFFRAVAASVHPHACGEYGRVALTQAGTGGSSPRMWGIRLPSAYLQGTGRFIPTHVGNTGRSDGPCPAASVHPHACGEYVHASVPALVGLRFIPTHVGNTGWAAPPAGCPPVHPHACGEYVTILTSTRKDNGSSPRMWGIRAGGGD